MGGHQLSQYISDIEFSGECREVMMGIYSVRAANWLRRNHRETWQAIVHCPIGCGVSLLERWENFVFYARRIQLGPELAAEQFVEIVSRDLLA